MAKRKKRSNRLATRTHSIPKKGRKEIPADLTKQIPESSWGFARLAYVDEEFVCKSCGKLAIWTAEDQKWYYETAKGSIYARASRCNACRKALSDAHAGTPKKTPRQRWDDRQRKLDKKTV